MKRTTLVRIIVAVIILGLLGMFVYAVIQVRSQKSDHEKKQVLTTFTVLADMTRQVAGDRVTVESITKPGAEIHGYEPTPGDIVRLQKADMVFDNGMNLEKWAEKLYQNVPKVPHVTLTSEIAPMPIAEGPYKDKPNPHAWMSPANALKYVDMITKALSDLDQKNASYFAQNADVYKQKIQAVDTKLKGELSKLLADQRYLVSCEGAFSYLIRDYDLKELYLWPINADAQGTPQQIRSVVETVRANNISAVFCESTVSDKAQRQVANETGAHYSGTFYVDSLSDESGPTPTYLKLLQYNADTLVKGLKS
jgi:manganese transport system substrate-binding protein